MDNEKNLDNQEKEIQQNEGRRYERVSRPAGSYSRENAPEGRTPRPRIGRSRINTREESGFRPSGFDHAEDNGEARYEGYSPRTNAPAYRPQGGYQSREGYQQRQENDYHQHQEGGYQHHQQGGYRPRNNYNNNYQWHSGGDYQPRWERGYQPRQQGGYRPHYGQEGQQGGYKPRPQGGYRPQGGFRPSGFGGQSQQGGYRKQHTPGYNPNAKYNMKKRIEYKEEHIDPNAPIRLNKFLANAGVCSRREADEFIQAGVVTVNGEVVTELGTKILRTDKVVFHDQPVTLEKKVYVLLNKPKDCVTTSDDPQQRKTVMDLVKDVCPERIYPVGRLDRNTTGVLLLTNDGELASKLTHPKFLKKKVYHVFLDKNLAPGDMQKIADGIELEDGEIHADAIEYASPADKSQVGIEIHSGKNRIVRRIFESLGYHVVRLDRVQFCGLTKKNVRRGDWRFLTEKEVEILRMGAFE